MFNNEDSLFKEFQDTEIIINFLVSDLNRKKFEDEDIAVAIYPYLQYELDVLERLFWLYRTKAKQMSSIDLFTCCDYLSEQELDDFDSQKLEAYYLELQDRNYFGNLDLKQQKVVSDFALIKKFKKQVKELSNKEIKAVLNDLDNIDNLDEELNIKYSIFLDELNSRINNIKKDKVINDKIFSIFLTNLSEELENNGINSQIILNKVYNNLFKD